MLEQYLYQIEIQGKLDSKTLSSASPYRVSEISVSVDSTLFTFRADQSGFVGMIRFLHQQGYVLLSSRRIS